MDLYGLWDCCAVCGAWCPKAEHEDMGRIFREDQLRQCIPTYPDFRTTSLPCSFSLSQVLGLRFFPPFPRKRAIVHDVSATQVLEVHQ